MWRDLGGHFDVAQRASAGTLGDRSTEATTQVISVGTLTERFHEGSAISDTSLGVFQSARECWPFWVLTQPFFVWSRFCVTFSECGFSILAGQSCR